MRRTLLCLGALVAACLLLPGEAAARSLVVRDFDAAYEVNRDGTVDVIERLTVHFEGSWNGVYRDLKLRNRTGDGHDLRVGLDIRSVTDASGQELRYDVERPGRDTRRLKIWVPGAEDATRTVVIRYRLEHALRFFDAESEVGELDELYWNATGTDWEMPIEQARVSVTLPQGVEPRQVAVYTGRQGSTASEAQVVRDRELTVFTAARELAPGEGMTVAVGFPGGVVARPAASAEAVGAAQRNWPLGLPLLALVLAFRTWSRRGKDPKELPIAVQYEPPAKMTPAELGTLLDNDADMHDITATLVDLAVRGYLRIEEQTKSKLFGLTSDTEYVFHLRKPPAEWEGLEPHEVAYLRGLFPSPLGFVGNGERYDPVKLSELKNHFYKKLDGIRDGIYGRLVARGYYRSRPDKVRDGWIGGGVALGAVALFATIWVAGSGVLGLEPIPVAIGGIGSALIVLGFGWFMPARTVAGARAREQALGFKEFLAKVESPVYRKMITSPELFERYLPHAMAFQVEDRWAKAFEGMFDQPPDWYIGNGMGGFHAGDFAGRMGDLMSTAGSTMSSSPSSSGSGGGGFSGGGGGGGGGGGF